MPYNDEIFWGYRMHCKMVFNSQYVTTTLSKAVEQNDRSLV